MLCSLSCCAGLQSNNAQLPVEREIIVCTWAPQTQGLLAINVFTGRIHKSWQWVTQPWGGGGCQNIGRGRAVPLKQQKQNMAELCLHPAKPGAFQLLNPFPCYFSFFLQSKPGSCGFPWSHSAAGQEKLWSAVAVAKQEEGQEGN